MLRTHGMNVNTGAIARGVFEMIPDDDRACMAVGMLPLEWMTRIEAMLRESIVLDRCPNAKGDELEILAKAINPEIISDTMRQVSADMLGIAKSKGLCVV